MNAEQLLQHFERISEAPDAIKRLRGFILDLAVRGKLVEQDPADEPAAELLKQIAAEKAHRRSVRGSIRSEGEVERWCSIPGTWDFVRLDGVCNVVMGSSPPGSTYNKNGEGIPLINGPVEFTPGPFGRTVINQYTTAPSAYCNEGDFLICVRGSTTGRINIAAFRACIGRGVAAIQPLFEDQFIRLAIRVRQEAILQMGRGIAFPSISREQLVGLPIPLPPLAEQHRIVAKVDELMSLCDQLEAAKAEREQCRDSLVAASLQGLNQPAEEKEAFHEHARFTFNNLQRITTRTAHIKQLRQAILNLAVRGKLVEQDHSDEPATELLKRIAAEKARRVKEGSLRQQNTLPTIKTDEVEFELAHGWEWVRMAEVIKLWNGFAFKSGDYQSTGVPVVRIGDLQGGEVVLSGVVRVSEMVAKQVGHEVWIPPDALLIAMSGATTGKTAFNRTKTKLLLNQRVGRIEVFEMSIDFLRFFFETIVAKNLSISFGTAIPNLSAQQINETVVPLPPLAEQHRIVAKVDELMAICDQLEAQITMTEQDSSRLLESVIAEALAPSIDICAEPQVA